LELPDQEIIFQLGLGFMYSAFFRLGGSPDAEDGDFSPAEAYALRILPPHPVLRPGLKNAEYKSRPEAWMRRSGLAICGKFFVKS
jgi:hypothetical protein